jgi:hypothetical protein
MRTKKSMRPKRSARAKKSVRFAGMEMKRMQAALIATICVVTLAAVVAARKPAMQTDSAAADSQSAAQTQAKKVAIPRSGSSAGVVASAGFVGDSASGQDSDSTPKPATITGCLEQDDANFKLTDTTGVDAPQSRSWKSGFIKKHAASVEVIDAAQRWHLSSHVGERVTISGTLLDRELKIRSLQRVASCS